MELSVENGRSEWPGRPRRIRLKLLIWVVLLAAVCSVGPIYLRFVSQRTSGWAYKLSDNIWLEKGPQIDAQGCVQFISTPPYSPYDDFGNSEYYYRRSWLKKPRSWHRYDTEGKLIASTKIDSGMTLVTWNTTPDGGALLLYGKDWPGLYFNPEKDLENTIAVCLSATGDERWRLTASQTASLKTDKSDPAAVLAVAVAGELYGVNQSGRIAWTLKPGNQVANTAAVAHKPYGLLIQSEAATQWIELMSAKVRTDPPPKGEEGRYMLDSRPQTLCISVTGEQYAASSELTPGDLDFVSPRPDGGVIALCNNHSWCGNCQATWLAQYDHSGRLDWTASQVGDVAACCALGDSGALVIPSSGFMNGAVSDSLLALDSNGATRWKLHNVTVHNCFAGPTGRMFASLESYSKPVGILGRIQSSIASRLPIPALQQQHMQSGVFEFDNQGRAVHCYGESPLADCSRVEAWGKGFFGASENLICYSEL